jgi:hypothetical protein
LKTEDEPATGLEGGHSTAPSPEVSQNDQTVKNGNNVAPDREELVWAQRHVPEDPEPATPGNTTEGVKEQEPPALVQGTQVQGVPLLMGPVPDEDNPILPESPDSEPAKEPASQVPFRRNPFKVTMVRQKPVNKIVAQAEPVTTDPLTTEAVTTDPVTTEPVKTVPVTTEPAKKGAVKTEQGRKGKVKPEPPKKTPAKNVFRKTELHYATPASTADERKRVRNRTLQSLKGQNATVSYPPFETAFKNFICSLMERQDEGRDLYLQDLVDLEQRIADIEDNLDLLKNAEPGSSPQESSCR